jgi:hypothetical protein
LSKAKPHDQSDAVTDGAGTKYDHQRSPDGYVWKEGGGAPIAGRRKWLRKTSHQVHELKNRPILSWRLKMSTEQDDIKTAMGALYGELLIAFRGAKENGLTW